MNRTARRTPPPRRTASTPRLGRRRRGGTTATLSEHRLSDQVVETIAEHGDRDTDDPDGHVRAEVLLTVLGPDGEPVAARLRNGDGRLALQVDGMVVDPASDHLWAWHEALVDRAMTLDLVQDGEVVVTIGDWDQVASA